MSVTVPPEYEDLLALQLAPQLGPRRTASLLTFFGSAARARRANVNELSQVPLIGPTLAPKLAKSLREVDVGGELRLMAEHGVHVRFHGTPDYPAALTEIPTAPPLLYVRGALAPADAVAVGVVGSRHPTDYGRRATKQLVTGLARAGVTVVSGLARGIDGVAHRAALDAGGRTVAVLAGGLSRIYPPEHLELSRAVEGAGALVTESSMGMAPHAPLFPARNRIISGLAQVVVIVEAGEKSGALITATHAAEQGRTCMAVPGPIDSPASAGTHALLRDGAILCRGADDILAELRGLSPVAHGNATNAPAAPPAASPPPGLTPEQGRVWEFLAGGPRTLDEMAQELGLGVPPLSGLLMMLEMRKAVRRLPGNRYERC